MWPVLTSAVAKSRRSVSNFGDARSCASLLVSVGVGGSAALATGSAFVTAWAIVGCPAKIGFMCRTEKTIAITVSTTTAASRPATFAQRTQPCTAARRRSGPGSARRSPWPRRSTISGSATTGTAALRSDDITSPIVQDESRFWTWTDLLHAVKVIHRHRLMSSDAAALRRGPLVRRDVCPLEEASNRRLRDEEHAVRADVRRTPTVRTEGVEDSPHREVDPARGHRLGERRVAVVVDVDRRIARESVAREDRSLIGRGPRPIALKPSELGEVGRAERHLGLPMPRRQLCGCST